MRRFLIKLIGGGIVTGGMSLFLFVLLMNSERRNYRQAITLPDNCVICNSDSMTVYGLNPEFWPDLVNISGEGAPFDVQLMKLKDAIELNPHKIRMVLLDVSILSIAVGKNKPIVTKGTYAGKYYPLYVWHRIDKDSLYASINDESEVAIDWFKFKLKKAIHRDFSSVLAQGYLKRDSSFIGKMGVQGNSGNSSYAQWVNAGEGYGMSSWSVCCIQEMMKLCQKNHIEICLMNMPLHHGITENIEPEVLKKYHAFMNMLAEEYHVRYFSFLQDRFEDGDFIDSNHLNWHGSQKMTEKLKTLIEK